LCIILNLFVQIWGLTYVFTLSSQVPLHTQVYKIYLLAFSC